MARRRRRHLYWLVAAVPLALVLLAGGFGVAWISAPSVADLGARVRARVREEGGHPVRFGAIAPSVREAVVATEDERFFRHDGIDVIGILRAVPYDITHLSLAEGASTITEQLAKLVYLGGNDHDPWAKLRDAAIAVRIESRYSKAQILDDYLNSVYFGAHAYGIQAASRRYFGAPPSKLTLAEASLLAGLIQDPTADNPYAHPSAARARQLDALRSMVSNGFATAREAKRALAHPLSLAHGPPLPPLRGARVEPGPAFYWLGLAIGLVAFALGGAALLVLRGRGGERIERVLRVVAEVGAVLVTIAGVLIVFASFRTV